MLAIELPEQKSFKEFNNSHNEVVITPNGKCFSHTAEIPSCETRQNRAPQETDLQQQKFTRTRAWAWARTPKHTDTHRNTGTHRHTHTQTHVDTRRRTDI